eukprot:153087_1
MDIVRILKALAIFAILNLGPACAYRVNNHHHRDRHHGQKHHRIQDESEYISEPSADNTTIYLIVGGILFVVAIGIFIAVNFMGDSGFSETRSTLTTMPPTGAAQSLASNGNGIPHNVIMNDAPGAHIQFGNQAVQGNHMLPNNVQAQQPIVMNDRR